MDFHPPNPIRFTNEISQFQAAAGVEWAGKELRGVAVNWIDLCKYSQDIKIINEISLRLLECLNILPAVSQRGEMVYHPRNCTCPF